MNVSGNLFNAGDDIHLRITVFDDQYQVFLNGGLTPVASLINGSVSSGGVGVYANSFQTFDNFEVGEPIPEPTSILLFGTALAGVVARHWWRRRP